jgi:hypothetical protein
VRALLLLALAPASMAWTGFVVMRLWGWFAVPAGFKPITVAWAYGLLCLVSAFKTLPKKSEDEPWTTIVAKAALGPLLSLAFGWIAHAAMVHWGW